MLYIVSDLLHDAIKYIYESTACYIHVNDLFTEKYDARESEAK